MALPNLPVPPFPDVPLAAGVPPVARDTSAVQIPPPTPLKADDSSVAQSQSGPQWGVFSTEGKPVLTPDSVVAVEYAKEWRGSDYPLEKGAFESYNKVTRPYEVRVTMSKGGTVTDRTNFLNALGTLAESLTLSNIVTPEQTYLNSNIQHTSYVRRSDNGAALIVAEISFIEIRTTVTISFASTKTDSGSSPVNGGAVQAKPLTPDEQAVLNADAADLKDTTAVVGGG